MLPVQKHVLLFLFLVAGSIGQAQNYTFKETTRLSATPVKNQEKTGTCWAFSTASFLESEVMRLGNGFVNLSEMFLVRHIYKQKCDNYVRRQGSARLSEGGLAHDALQVAAKYGLMPEQAYPGRKDPSKPLNHGALVKSLKSLCDNLVAQAIAGTLPADWPGQIDYILDEEFGPLPKNFEVDGKTYNPVTYRNMLGINPANYVTLTSFTHHPFYASFILEIPDNFANGLYFNVSLEDLMRCLNYSLLQGYTVDWDTDNSNTGFSGQKGIAIVPARDWKEKTPAEQAATFVRPESEMKVKQQNRQEMFDRQITQDDHLMQIVGIAQEANAGTFYIVKNSWGEISDYKGYLYASEAYLRLNTIAFTFHIDALPTEIREKVLADNGSALELSPTIVPSPAQPPKQAKPGEKPYQQTTPAEPGPAPKPSKRINN